MPAWHTGPPDESGGYICTDGQTVFMAWYDKPRGCWWDSDGATYFAGPMRVTHWMPKPLLPRKEGLN